MSEKFYDVVVCGGGLAGLTIARQLARKDARLRIAVVERDPGPVEPAAHKVGEATVEGGAHYFTEILGLTGYFNTNHLHKLGLRLFFGDPHGPFERRPELGPRRFPRVSSYQIDRGIFERDLRRMVAEQGVTLLEGSSVSELEVREDDQPHVVHLTSGEERREDTLTCRFIVDASGRRRLLQKKFALTRDNGHHISAVWWRLRGEYDVEKMAGATNPRWKPKHQDRRWFSTNHLMGRGYWVWIIPLSSGNTSIGIVTDEAIHPFATYGTWESALAWLRTYEPTLARFTEGAEVMDFLKMKDASYGSAQIFSEHRWSCVGEAGFFYDPFYSPGSDVIAYTNTITCKLIELDRAGHLDRPTVDLYNRFMLRSAGENFLQMYRDNYGIFGNATVMYNKVLWDVCHYWGLPSQMLFRNLLGEPEAVEEFCEIADQFLPVQREMQQFFRDWGEVAEQPRDYTFIEYAKVPFCASLHLDLLRHKDRDQTLREMRLTVDKLRDWGGRIRERVDLGAERRDVHRVVLDERAGVPA